MTRASWVWIALLAIIVVGFFLRTYQFADLLRFELDQARDARVIDDGLAGSFFDLPLLGPRAAGTFLRLGPGFYYLEYLSAKLFGENPVGMAWFVPILSTATLALFFFYMRRVFPMLLSLSVTALFAVSTYFVLYGRFAWNPNPLPFFLIGGFLALLMAVDPETKRRGLLLIVAAGLLSFATQLHFLVFVSVPIIVSLFLLWKRPHFRLREWLLALSLALFLYAPVVLNEIEAGGSNSQEFLQAVTGKSSKGDHPFLNKLVKNAIEQVNGYVVVLSGYEKGELPTFKTKPQWDILCDGGCREGLWAALFALSFTITGALLLIYRAWRSTGGGTRDFYVLNLLWLAIGFLILVPIAFNYSPRFFLLLAPLPFILLALPLYALMTSRFSRMATPLIFGVLGLLLMSNLYFTEKRLHSLQAGRTEAVRLQGADRILKDKARVALGQQNDIVDHMQNRSRETGYPVYMFSEPEHRRALKYLMERRGIDNAVLGFDGVYQEGVYFLIIRSLSDLEAGTRKYRAAYDVLDQKPFGTLTLFELKPRPETVKAIRQDFSQVPPPAEDTSRAPRYTWRQWWERSSGQEEEDDAPDENEIDEAS